MRSSFAAALVAASLAANLAPERLTATDPLAADWERFRKGPVPEPGYVASLDDGLRDILWSAARARARVGDAIDGVTRRFGIDRETAAALVEATLVGRAIEDIESDAEPDPAQVERALSALWRAYRRAPGATIVLQQAGWILSSLELDPDHEQRVLEELRRSTDPAPLTAHIAAMGLCRHETQDAAIELTLERRPAHPVLLLAGAALHEDDACLSVVWARAALKAASASGVNDSTFLAAARNRLVAASLEAGLLREAIDALASLPPGEVEAALAEGSQRLENRLLGLEYELQVYSVRPAVAAAAFLIGKHESARELSSRPRKATSSDRREDRDEGESLDLVKSVIHRLSGDSLSDPFDILDRAIVLNDSWHIRRFLPTTRLFARLALESGYPEIAADLAEMPVVERPHAAPERFRAEVDACRTRSEQVMDEFVREARSGVGPTAGSDPAAGIVAQSLAAQPSQVFAERPLPEGIPAWDPSNTEHERRGRALEKWKVPELWPVRVEQNGKSVIAIGLSQDYDPGGEVSGGGYWIVRSGDGGKTWGRPLYTGLRPMQPYVIPTLSRLPLIAGDRLQIEVAIRELDEARISFPPIGRSFKRERTGLYLDVAWADLERDRDADRLTDLAEERLMTDPLDADTDGDGLSDGADPLPHIAWSRTSSVDAGALAAVLRGAMGESLQPILIGDPGGQDSAPSTVDNSLPAQLRDAVALTSEATIFLVGDRRPFAGLSLERRTIVLTGSEASLARERFGIHYPGTLRLYVSHSGTRALAIWDESWRGMTLRLTKERGDWAADVVSSWIT